MKDRNAKRGIGLPLLSLLSAMVLVAFYNISYWQQVISVIEAQFANPWRFIPLYFIATTAFIAAALSLLMYQRTTKPLLFILIWIAAFSDYFIKHFGVVFDEVMIQNILETNTHEVLALVSWGLLWHLTLFAMIPTVILALVKINYRPWKNELLIKAIWIMICLIIYQGVAMATSETFKRFAKTDRYLNHIYNPVAPIYYSVRLLLHSVSGETHQFNIIGSDAKRVYLNDANNRKSRLVIVVVGETSRSESYSLNGYQRDTNPLLEKQPVISYRNVSSCGTATIVSVPCMFSPLTRKEYSKEKFESSENLVDVIKHAGFNLLWRDNDEGSKNVASRIPQQNVQQGKDNILCHSGECYDDVLLENLQAEIDKNKGDMVVFLHQEGGHGPEYYKRYPQDLIKFSPICSSGDLKACSHQKIINSYDNTIVYTDHFLNGVINFLNKNNDKYATAMIFLADHGESTGENGIYLHATPYAQAPSEQTKVPWIVWFSTDFQQQYEVNTACLKQNIHKSYSQDNFFHSMLGILNISTSLYQPNMDIFENCRQELKK